MSCREAREHRRVVLTDVPCDWQGHAWISRVQARPLDGRPLSEGDENRVNQDLAALIAEIRRILRQAGVRVEEPAFVPIPAERISVGRLPNTGELLLGREGPLARLDEAWERGSIHVVTVVAPGGVGKTALVNAWLAHVEMDHHRGAMRVFDWSFYSQGSSDVKSATGEPFIHEALRWLEDPDPTEGSPWQKGERLANLVRKERTLLILDGLEPLQEPPRAGVVPGRLKDPGVEALLKNLSSANPGLCIVTTRETVEALAPRVGKTVETIDLHELSLAAGAALLREHGVQGPGRELKEVSKEFGGHALALTLLATYLRDVCDGDVRRWGEVPLLEEDAEQGGHAFRVMRSYENWLGEGPELEILYLLGLFDRPANEGEIGALLEGPAIPGLTDELVSGGEARWKRAVARLREARLVSAESGLGKEGGLDAHPLVRKYFGERLESERPDAFRAGHLRLYKYLRKLAPEYPDTLEGMQPLYHAVIHGCRGGRAQAALDEVYYPRIQRGAAAYSTHTLGAIGSELAALSGLFVHPWDRVATGLSDAAKGFVLNEAGLDLRAQGRLSEAVVPLQTGLKTDLAQEDWKNAAIKAGNLSELLLNLGKVKDSIEVARDSVRLADRSGNTLERLKQRTKLADVLHYAGWLEEARALFVDAETMQAQRQPGYHLLYSLQGCRYCDLLLTLAFISARIPTPSAKQRSVPEAEFQAVLQRAEQTIKIAEGEHWLLVVALDHLTLGRAHLGLALTTEGPQVNPTHLARATDHLNHSVGGLRQSGRMDQIPCGLLARAALWRWTDEPEKATADLDEAFQTSERAGMRLHLTDAHLERARLHIAQGEIDEAREDVEAARRLVEETGYHRRDPEVAELEALWQKH